MNSWETLGPVVAEVDGSIDGLRVVDYASRTAVRAGTDLVIVAPYHRSTPHTSLTSRSASAIAEENLRDAAAHAKRRHGRGLVIRTVAMEGSRVKVLQAATREASVLVVARSYDSATSGLISTQGNLALAARIGRPVIVIPTGWQPMPTERGIAVGIDGTPLSLEAVEFAFRTASDRHANLTVVHSHHLAYHAPDGADGSWQERAGLTVSETLAGWDEEYPHVKVTRLLTTRPVVATLARESEDVDLIVVGAHTGPLPIGDPVARRTIAEMPCPVAIVAHHVTPAERDQHRREVDTAMPIN
ncbi:universal stress protein [Kribbella sp. NBC_00709]|uniref:universal stress protein n=1 Tax=Kribbella sp. NBC_00709 TaxID=2975972 RepID=UPI002E28483C|nr:universal stress protein [Kribbella sp. NBC_00709]